MNAVEIEEAVSALADAPFDAAEFPFAFLAAFGNKDTTIKRLRSGVSNKSDLGGVLHTGEYRRLQPMRPMTDAEVLAAIDRGLRRVWARFPTSADAPPKPEKAPATEHPPTAKKPGRRHARQPPRGA